MYQDNLDNDIYEDDYYDTPIERSNWGPNLFARIVEFLQKSTSPDVIRLGIIADVRNSTQSEDPSYQLGEGRNHAPLCRQCQQRFGLAGGSPSQVTTAVHRMDGLWTVFHELHFQDES